MSLLSFWIRFNLRKNSESIIDEVKKSTDLYKHTFNCWCDGLENPEICLEASMVNFFPACEMLYEVLQDIDRKYSIKLMYSGLGEHENNFDTFLEFFSWIYTSNYDKLKYFNKHWGGFVVNPTKFDNVSMRSVKKKYFVKF